MHAFFYIRGDQEHVKTILTWLHTRMAMSPFKNPKLVPHGPKDNKGNLLREGFQPVNCQVRDSIFGMKELVFPQSEMDTALTTLGFHKPLYPDTVRMKMFVKSLRLAVGLDPIPEFKQDKVFPMPDEIMAFVSIIPIGVKYDKLDHEFPDGIIREFL